MMPVKADLAIHSSVIGVSEYCRSVAFMSSHYLDFSSCGIVAVDIIDRHAPSNEICRQLQLKKTKVRLY